jgi:hypothetical protein
MILSEPMVKAKTSLEKGYILSPSYNFLKNSVLPQNMKIAKISNTGYSIRKASAEKLNPEKTKIIGTTIADVARRVIRLATSAEKTLLLQ